MTKRKFGWTESISPFVRILIQQTRLVDRLAMCSMATERSTAWVSPYPSIRSSKPLVAAIEKFRHRAAQVRAETWVDDQVIAYLAYAEEQ